MRNTQLGSLSKTVLVVAVVCGMLVAPTAAQTATTVTFDSSSETVDGSTTVSLLATDVPADSSIGAYELNLTYNSDVVSLSVTGTDRYDVSTETTGSSGTVTTTVVGYTGASDGDGGNTTLATVTVNSEGNSGDTTLDVSTVETFSDTDSNAVGYSIGASLGLSVDTGDGGGNGGFVSGGGGGGSLDTQTETPTPTPVDTETPTPVPVDTETPAATEDIADEPRETATDTTTETTGGSGPGFTAGLSVIALLVTAFLFRLRS
jgi:PGF-CTERM protein